MYYCLAVLCTYGMCGVVLTYNVCPILGPCLPTDNNDAMSDTGPTTESGVVLASGDNESCIPRRELEPVSYTHLDVYKRQVFSN